MLVRGMAARSSSSYLLAVLALALLFATGGAAWAGDRFFLQDAEVRVVAAFHPTGNLKLAGTLQQEVTTITPSSSLDEWIVYDSTGVTVIAVIRIDDPGSSTIQGNMQIKGILHYAQGSFSPPSGSRFVFYDGASPVAAIDNSGNLWLKGYLFTSDANPQTDNQSPSDIQLATALDAKLTASDGAAGDSFGSAVAVSGETAVMGASGDTVQGKYGRGSAYIFRWNGSGWVQEAKLDPSVLVDYLRFGSSVGISGDSVIVGVSPVYGGTTGARCAYIFERIDGSWSQTAKLTESSGNPTTSVAIQGDTAVFGQRETSSDSGRAHVYSRQGDVWYWDVTLLEPVGAPAGTLFGSSVAVSGNSIIVGSLPASSGNPINGMVYVYRRNPDTGIWESAGSMNYWTGTSAPPAGAFIESVGIMGDAAVVGSSWQNYVGKVNVLKQGSLPWTDALGGGSISGSSSNRFGCSAGIWNRTVVAGAYSASGKGKVYSYQLNDTATPWTSTQTGTLEDTGGAGGDDFGKSVGISQALLAIGAPGDDDKGADSGSAFVRTLNPAVFEHSANGTVVATITGTDPESNPLTFSLQSNSDGIFEVVNVSGTWKLRVANNTCLEYELASQRSITIRATDCYGAILDEVFNIQVLELGRSWSFGLQAATAAQAVQLAWEPYQPQGTTTGYNIYRSTSPDQGFTFLQTVTAPGSGEYVYLKDTNVQVGTAYYYYVGIVNSQAKGYSNVAGAAAGTACEQPWPAGWF